MICSDARNRTAATLPPRLALAMLVAASAVAVAACGQANGDSAGRKGKDGKAATLAVPV